MGAFLGALALRITYVVQCDTNMEKSAENSDLPSDVPHDRVSVAEFLLSNESRIRNVARQRLSRGSKSLTDSADIFSSVCRRIDRMAFEGRLKPVNRGQLWRLIETITINTALNRTRVAQRLNDLFADYATLHDLVWSRLNTRDDDDFSASVISLTACLDSPEDREQLRMRLHGLSHGLIAKHFGIEEADARQRWHRLCIRLRTTLQDKQPNP